jgi:hypothetical protein
MIGSRFRVQGSKVVTIEYLRNSIELNRKDRAKRYHKSSIFNLQFRLIRVRLKQLDKEDGHCFCAVNQMRLGDENN